MNSDWGEKYSIQLQGSLRGAGNTDVPQMRRVETATKKSNSPFANRGLVHLFMLEQIEG